MTVLEALQAWHGADVEHKEDAWLTVVDTAYEANTNWPVAVAECLFAKISVLEEDVQYAAEYAAGASL